MRSRRRATPADALFSGRYAPDHEAASKPWGGRAYPSAEAVKPLEPGAAVPSAIVRSIDGQPVDLAKLVHDEGALLVFYRGGW